MEKIALSQHLESSSLGSSSSIDDNDMTHFMGVGDMSDVDSDPEDPWITASSFQASLDPHPINPWDQPTFHNYINKTLNPITSAASILVQGCVDETHGYIYNILNETREQVLKAICRFNQVDSDLVFKSDCKKSEGSCISVLDLDDRQKLRVFMKSGLFSGNEVRIEAPPGVTIGWIKRKRFRSEYKVYSSANTNKSELYVAKTKTLDKKTMVMISQDAGDEDYVVVEEERDGSKSIAGYLFTTVNFHDEESHHDLLACTFSKQLSSISKILIFSCLLLVDSEMFSN